MNFLFGTGSNSEVNKVSEVKSNPFDEFEKNVKNTNNKTEDQVLKLTIDKLSNPEYSKSNCIYVKSSITNYVKVFNPDGLASGIYKVIEDNSIGENQVCFNNYQRMYLKAMLTKSIDVIPWNKPLEPIGILTLLIKNISTKNNPYIEIDDDEVEKIKKSIIGIPIISNHQYIYNNILNMVAVNQVYDNQIITESTQLKIITTDSTINIVSSQQNEVFKSEFNFKEMGIGGLDKQFEIIFRRAFASRIVPEKILKDLGINHVRGILLYGPPGCGKTIIARQIGKILNCEEPKIVNGPSLLGKYVGESEENVRKLFEDAIRDKNSKKLHLIICDEFDALAKKRGMNTSDSGVSDKVVNQFLTMIDGPESLNNILLICMTNRRDLIDDALLRPGRLEVQIEIGIPDEKGRKDILAIHTNKMSSGGYLQNVNLDIIANETKNYTGAELESVVKTAVSYSIAKELDPSNLSNIKTIRPVVTQEYFERALLEIKPQFGTRSPQIEIITANSFEFYSNEYKKVYDEVLDKISKLNKGKMLSILIQGDNYIGKTTLACQIASNSGFNCIKFVNSESLINYPMKEQILYEQFDSGNKSDSFVLVLDSIEKIIEYSKLGNIYNNKILQTIYTILDRIVEPTKSIVIIMTSSNRTLMQQTELNILSNFTYQLIDTTHIQSGQMVSAYFKSKKFNS